jgi:hypothetical protein
VAHEEIVDCRAIRPRSTGGERATLALPLEGRDVAQRQNQVTVT